MEYDAKGGGDKEIQHEAGVHSEILLNIFHCVVFSVTFFCKSCVIWPKKQFKRCHMDELAICTMYR